MTHDVERVLADINADHGDRCVEFLRHGVLLVLSAPSQLLVLAGREHGRTIPLADGPTPRVLAKPSGSGTFETCRVTSRIFDDRSNRKWLAGCQSGAIDPTRTLVAVGIDSP